jgi:uncharacterized membrane protein (DUF4010 family)
VIETLDWTLIRSVLISLALGALIGLERQSHHDPDRSVESIGVRTFSLASLLGTVSVIAADVSPAIPWVTGAGYLMFVLAFLFFEARARDTQPGITTQVSALLVYIIGAFVPTQPIFAAVIAVVVGTILSIKDWTHRIVQNLTDEEVLGTMKFLLVSVVLLPILPNEPVDPWELYNLQELWFLVVLISGISFAGYFAIRILGRDRGIALTGALGGLASSTAVTLAMGHRVRASGGRRPVELAAAFAILIASGILSLRLIVIVFAVSPELAVDLAAPLIAMAVPGVAVAGYFWWRISTNGVEMDGPDEPEADEPDAEAGESTSDPQSDEELEFDNPFELAPAVKFGLLFAVIIGGVQLAKMWMGDSGIQIAAFISGLANMDAISVTMARMVDAGQAMMDVGVRAVVIGVVANSLSKSVLALVTGSRRLCFFVVGGFLPMILTGLGYVFMVMPG